MLIAVLRPHGSRIKLRRFDRLGGRFCLSLPPIPPLLGLLNPAVVGLLSDLHETDVIQLGCRVDLFVRPLDTPSGPPVGPRDHRSGGFSLGGIFSDWLWLPLPVPRGLLFGHFAAGGFLFRLSSRLCSSDVFAGVSHDGLVRATANTLAILDAQSIRVSRLGLRL